MRNKIQKGWVICHLHGQQLLDWREYHIRQPKDGESGWKGFDRRDVTWMRVKKSEVVYVPQSNKLRDSGNGINAQQCDLMDWEWSDILKRLLWFIALRWAKYICNWNNSTISSCSSLSPQKWPISERGGLSFEILCKLEVHCMEIYIMDRLHALHTKEICVWERVQVKVITALFTILPSWKMPLPLSWRSITAMSWLQTLTYNYPTHHRSPRLELNPFKNMKSGSERALDQVNVRNPRKKTIRLGRHYGPDP